MGKGVSWQTFQALLTDIGDARAWIIAYDNGVLEIRMPYQKQEVPIIILAYLVNAIADELEIKAMQVGALLRKKEELQRAIEPDTCFYIRPLAKIIRTGKMPIPQELFFLLGWASCPSYQLRKRIFARGLFSIKL